MRFKSIGDFLYRLKTKLILKRSVKVSVPKIHFPKTRILSEGKIALLFKKCFSHSKKSVFMPKIYPENQKTSVESARKFRLFSDKKGGLLFQLVLLGCFLGTGLAFFLTPSYENLIKYVQIDDDETDAKREEVDESLLIEKDDSDEMPVHPFFEEIAPEEEVSVFSDKIKRGETLSSFLKRTLSLSLKEALAVSKALDPVYALNKIQTGQRFYLFLSDNRFAGLFFTTRQGDCLSVKKDMETGEMKAFTKEGQLQTERKRLSGTIRNSLTQTLAELKAPVALANEIEHAFKDQLNMRTDLKPKGKMTVVFDETTTKFGTSSQIRLLFISLETRIGTKELYHFKTKRGKSAYFNRFGETGNQTLLQRPLGRKRRISSPFGMRRHPILKYRIMHSGTDFAAPKGTPIPAGGDGVIVRLGRRGGYGKHIQIKHNNTYSTLYAHMNGYARSSKVGAYVKKGQIIGYVGSTGRSTGPHLHYEIRKRGKAVNPLQKHVLVGTKLKGSDLKNFKLFAKEVNASYSSTPDKSASKRETTSRKSSVRKKSVHRQRKSSSVPVPPKFPFRKRR